LARVHFSPAGQLAAAAAAACATPWYALLLLAACAGGLFVALRRLHATESLLVLRGLGVQTRSSGATFLSAGGTRFIPTEKIRDVLLNEAFRGYEVVYYLLIVVDGDDDVVVVFPKLLPGLDIVESVWRGVRGCLYESGGGGGGDGDEKG
jgi:phosphatidylinositol N-acetylglucosaminyltransferase subunit H